MPHEAPKIEPCSVPFRFVVSIDIPIDVFVPNLTCALWSDPDCPSSIISNASTLHHTERVSVTMVSQKSMDDLSKRPKGTLEICDWYYDCYAVHCDSTRDILTSRYVVKIEQMNEMRTCECVSVSHCFPSFFTAPPDTQSIDAIMVMHPHRTYQVGAWWWWSDKVITITTTAVRRNHQESYWIPHHSNDLRPWLRLLLPVVQLPAMGLRMVLP